MPTSLTDVQIGKRMRLLRKARKVSQEKLAAALGITFQQVQKYEHGKNRMAAVRLYQVACLLHVPINFFFEGFGEPVAAEAVGLSETQEAFSATEDDVSPSYDAADLQLLMRPETVRLVRTYYRITDGKIRRDAFDLIEKIAGVSSKGD
ncbi:MULTISPECIES: helix-turn-helix domain-containing protein [unclassified Saccharibacter]|uniref:helix-turn-helix domain-containing protein n=1 Tax=unclassified Saccharibacter TaxID=2648722 RepID=UPI00132BAB9A|nr:MULTISPECIES: helix-turn-helix transcriptional regulator [unclassified Saccharibacter]MXV36570.1 helix-turn-helix domain-containing protein [Saccharibacter sp. EH611]MXV57732.1 helix-turn-helix domain-containing protein [Saccharibacter sp. EH70]MXV64961.1 helix-turn-helix domain-containing protein [Saccharibacter sp. EH60]